MSNNPITDLFSIFGEGRRIAQALMDIRDTERKQLQVIQQQNRSGATASSTTGSTSGTSVSTAKGHSAIFSANDSLQNIEHDVREIAKKLGVDESSISTAKASSGETSDEELESTDELIEHQKRSWDKFFDGLKALFDSFKVVVMSLLDAWGKVDQAAYDFQKTLGGSRAAAKAMRKNTIDTVVNRHIGDRFNTSSDELIKLEQNYDRQIGRRAALANGERESFAAMNALMGADRAGEFAKAYEKFGKNIEGASTAASRLYKDAAKNGVAFEKYSENVLQNIKLAQSYNFANGTRGLEEMAMKATALKLDMQSVAQMADKVSSVEGATTAAANLSVLGGSFAGFSNPMSMLYEGLNDVGALTDRITNMFGDLAYFDKNTGEIDMSAFNKQRVKAAAQAAGMSSDALMDMIYTKARINQLEPEISGLNVSDEVKNLLKNSAQIGEDGKGYVTLNGQKKNLSQITNNDVEALKKLNQTEGDNIREIAEILRGWNDSVSGMEKQYEANKAQIAEMSGLGELSKGIVEAIGTSNSLLKGIWATLGLLTIGGGALAFGGGIRALFGRGVGAAATRGGAATAGRTAAAGGTGGTTAPAVVGAGRATGGSSAAGRFFGAEKRAGYARGVRAANWQSNLKYGRDAGRFKKFIGGVKGAKLGTGGAIGGIGAGLMTAIDEFGGDNDHMIGEKLARTGGSTLGGFIGGALGSFLGPLGTLAGAALGSAIGNWAGGLAGMSPSEKREFKEKYGLTNLLGDYTGKELQAIRRHRDEGEPIDESLRRKMEDAGDLDFYAEGTFPTQRISTGIVKGPPHSEGGVPGVSKATGRFIELEGKEMVLSKEDTSMFLRAMASWKNYAKSTPRADEYNPVQVIKPQNIENTAKDGGTIKIEPMDIKISGSIKLEGAGGQSTKLNFDELLRNRQFVDKLADLMFTYIQKHMALGKNGEMNYRKFGVS